MGGSHPHDSPLHTVPLMGVFPTTGERYGNFSARMKPKRPGVAPGAFRRWADRDLKRGLRAIVCRENDVGEAPRARAGPSRSLSGSGGGSLAGPGHV
jgi:hypothetical protein